MYVDDGGVVDSWIVALPSAKHGGPADAREVLCILPPPRIPIQRLLSRSQIDAVRN